MNLHPIAGCVTPHAPIDDRQQERDMIELAQGGDLHALEGLVRSSVNWLARKADRYSGTSAEAEDLFQAGAIGLMEGVARFPLTDPDGVRLLGYARGHVLHEIMSAVAASQPGFSMSTSSWKRHKDTALAPSGTDVATLSDWDTAASPEDEVTTRELVRHIVGGLPTKRERDIVSMAYGLDGSTPMPDHEIAAALGLVRETVCRLRKRALAHLATSVTPDDLAG